MDSSIQISVLIVIIILNTPASCNNNHNTVTTIIIKLNIKNLYTAHNYMLIAVIASCITTN